MAVGGMITPPILSSDSSDNEEEEVTTTDIIKRVMKGWQNEKLSPELLPPVTGELGALQIELVTMEGNLRKLEATDIRRSIHRMEVKRLRFMITAYLRVRLLKIQEYPWSYGIRQEKLRSNQPSILMPNEIIFLKEYLRNLEMFMIDVAIQHMPMSYRKFTHGHLMMVPNSNRFVFFKSDMDVTISLADANKEEEDADIRRGCQYVMRYKPLRKYLQNGEISLI